MGNSALVIAPTLVVQTITQLQNNEHMVQEALQFFFSPKDAIFCEFMLEEIITVLDASGRGAIQELSWLLGLNNFPVPGFI